MYYVPLLVLLLLLLLLLLLNLTSIWKVDIIFIYVLRLPSSPLGNVFELSNLYLSFFPSPFNRCMGAETSTGGNGTKANRGRIISNGKSRPKPVTFPRRRVCSIFFIAYRSNTTNSLISKITLPNNTNDDIDQ